jgi:glutaredoxin 3
MSEVTIYTKSWCPYCQKAKALLDSKQVTYEEIDVGHDPEGQAAMAQRAHGRSTVPQIFINGTHVGGCDDLHALNDAGKLDTLLAG